MQLTQREIETLQTLAARYAALAAEPVQDEKRKLWYALNRGDMQRPMILIDQMPWNELRTDDSLICTIADPYWRGVENQLRRDIYKATFLCTDAVLTPYLCLPRPIASTGYGVETHKKTLSTDKTNDVVSQTFENQLTCEEDLDKIKTPVITLDQAREKEIMQLADHVFAGIIDYKMTGQSMHLGLWDWISQWMGVENCYFALVDEPEFVHALMQRLTDAVIGAIRQLNEIGGFDIYSTYCHCSHTFSDDLPPAGCDPAHPVSTDAWAFGLAQLFTSVSPAITEEFEVPYMQQLFPYFGAVYYGCCDRLDDRLDIILKMPKIRKISCSPWSDREHFAEALPRHIVMSNKPSPALLATDSFDEDAVRQDLRRTIEAARRNGKNLELILKDISTVRYDPKRLMRWSQIATEEAMKF